MAFLTGAWAIDLAFYTLAIIVYLYLKVKDRLRFFEKRGIPAIETSTLLGSDIGAVFFKRHLADSWDAMYKKMNGKKVFGFFQGPSPTLFIRDPDCVNAVLISSFDHFQDRNFYIDEETNPLDAHLFFLKGQKWRYLRNKLSPIFTSGKLKWMYDEMYKCGDQFLEHIEQAADGRDIDMKDYLSRFTTDVIASCAFGLEAESMKNPDSEFRKVGRKFFEPSVRNGLVLLGRILFPGVMARLKIRTIPQDVHNFFITVMKQTLDHRRQSKIVRKDFIHLLVELKEKGHIDPEPFDNDGVDYSVSGATEKIEITDALLTAQSLVFCLAGFETTSSCMYFTLYMLAKHQELQDKVRKEIRASILKHGNFTYDALKEMNFLDKCIAETLRMYPPVPALNRECTKDLTLPDGTRINKGMGILLPVYSLHRDPKYFPEPFEYKPERFDKPPTNGTYAPFGDGPRICIGKRFAQMEMKMMLGRLLDQYSFKESPGANNTVTFNPKSFIIYPENKILLNITKLNGY